MANPIQCSPFTWSMARFGQFTSSQIRKNWSTSLRSLERVPCHTRRLLPVFCVAPHLATQFAKGIRATDEVRRGMKLRTIAYWVATAFVAMILGISAGMSLAHAAPLMKGLAHLGYPKYFANILGVGKVIGICVFLAPSMRRLKEWAYAGFCITILSACDSHYSAGERLLALEPLITFAALVISYFT